MNYYCEEKTKAGHKCLFKAKHNYDNKLLCTIHLNSIKSNEDCPICFEPMKDKKVDACGKKHYYHIMRVIFQIFANMVILVNHLSLKVFIWTKREIMIDIEKQFHSCIVLIEK
jgi:hypothetical protein